MSEEIKMEYKNDKYVGDFWRWVLLPFVLIFLIFYSVLSFLNSLIMFFPKPWTRYVTEGCFFDLKVWRRVIGPIYIRVPVSLAWNESNKLEEMEKNNGSN